MNLIVLRKSEVLPNEARVNLVWRGLEGLADIVEHRSVIFGLQLKFLDRF